MTKMADENGKQELTQEVEAIQPEKKRSFAGKVIGHYKRWWWLHIIIWSVVTLVLVLSLVYAGYPHIAQTDINEAGLKVNAIRLTNPTPTSVHLFQNSSNHNPSHYHPRLSAFNASLFLEDTEPDIKPFTFIEIPKLHATKNSITVVDQDVKIADNDQFIAYTSLVLGSEQYRMGIRGHPTLKEMRFPTIHVNFNKAVTLKGLNKLAGFNVTALKILLTPEPDGANMLGTVKIPNPSVHTIELGNVTLALSVTGTPIGTSLLPDLTLVPGDNHVPMRTTANQSLVLEKLSAYKDGMLPVDIVGQSVIYKGQHLPYYEIPLKATTQHVKLNAGAALAAIGL